MTRYIIQTGDYTTEQVAANLTDAVIAAFKRRAPKEPSLLTRARSLRGRWNYISTEAMLKQAGYKVRTEACGRADNARQELIDYCRDRYVSSAGEQSK